MDSIYNLENPMKKIFVLLLTGIMVLVFNCIVFAGLYIYKPSGSNLADLEHGSAYSWKINLSNYNWRSLRSPSDITSETIKGASLFFKNIYDSTGALNVLHVSLLDASKINSDGLDVIAHNDDVITYNDGGETSNFFEFEGKFGSTSLFKFNDISTEPLTIGVPLNNTERSNVPLGVGTGATMDMPANGLNHLISYASSGIFGLGFDPDCHFWTDGIYLALCTEKTSGNPVPEPATFLLFGAGLLFFASKMRKKYTEV